MTDHNEETRARELMQGAPFVVAQVDREGRLVAWNTAAERLFGVRSDAAVGRPIGAVVAVPGGEAAWQALIAAGQPARREWPTLRADQHTVTCAWTLHPLPDGGAACYAQELAAPTPEAAQQRIRDILLRGMLDNMDIVAWVTDAKGICVLIDGKGLADTGIPPEQLLGNNLLEVFGAKYPALYTGLQGTPVRFLTQEGAAHFENWAIPMYDEHGEVSALVGLGVDITAARLREEELQAKLDVIERQQRAMREMSTPIIEVWDHVICLPVVGLVDTARTAEIMDSLLQAVARTRARFAILDLTGVDVLDTATADHLLGLTRALRLLGAEGVLTGIHPNVAQTVVTLGVDLSGLMVRATLRDALKHVLAVLSPRR